METAKSHRELCRDCAEVVEAIVSKQPIGSWGFTVDVHAPQRPLEHYGAEI